MRAFLSSSRPRAGTRVGATYSLPLDAFGAEELDEGLHQPGLEHGDPGVRSRERVGGPREQGCVHPPIASGQRLCFARCA